MLGHCILVVVGDGHNPVSCDSSWEWRSTWAMLIAGGRSTSVAGTAVPLWSMSQRDISWVDDTTVGVDKVIFGDSGSSRSAALGMG